MRRYRCSSHTVYALNFHSVFVPKYRRKRIYGRLRREIGHLLRELCLQKGVILEEAHAMPDHIHLLLSIPPKFSVASVVGFLKGKSAIRIHRTYIQQQRFKGYNFWARGYFVSTVGADEAWVRAYIRHQEKEDRRQENLRLS